MCIAQVLDIDVDSKHHFFKTHIDKMISHFNTCFVVPTFRIDNFKQIKM